MNNVAQLLEAKGGNVWSIAPDASVFDAIAAMAEHGIGALPVMDGDRLLGVVSERDYARKVILQGRNSQDTKVAEIMTDKVTTTDLHETVEGGLAIMTEQRIRHLPVVEDGKVIGMLSIGDLVKALIAEQQALIKQLQGYIAG